MNKLIVKKTVLFLFSISVACFVSGKELETAQSDSLLKREMLLEAEYNPTIRDANKISILPQVEEPKPVKANIAYSSWAIATSPYPEPTKIKAGHFGLEEMLYRKKGYVTFGGGNLLNFRGAAGYEVLNTEEDFLQFSVKHFSTNGNVRSFSDGYSGDTKIKAKLNDNYFKGLYKHRFDFFDLLTSIDYNYTGFNYYGYREDYSLNNSSKNQVFHLINPTIGIKSTEEIEDGINYEAKVDYRFFMKNKNQAFDGDGVKENDISTFLHGIKDFDLWKAGLKFDMHNFFYSQPNNDSYYLIDNQFKNYSTFAFTPYYESVAYDNTWKLHVGARLDLATRNKKFRIAPDVLAQYDFYNGTWIYAEIGGGRNFNSQHRIAKENRYVNPDLMVEDSHTPIDARLGVKSTTFQQWFINAYVRYRKTNDDHFYAPAFVSNEQQMMFNVNYYDKMNLMQIGGEIAFNHRDMIKASVKMTKNFWDTKYSDDYMYNSMTKPINLADVTLDATLEIAFLPQLKSEIGFEWQGGRYGLFDTDYYNITKMKDIQNLTFNTSYIFNSSLSLYLSLNNILNKKYDYWYTYPEQGFSAMAGFSFMF